MVGGNAVGGLAGVIRGDFDIDQISSNIGANSTRASTLYNYSIYMSKNNKKNISQNLANVYYAGSVVGILDGYSNSIYNIAGEGGSFERDISDKYYMVRNVEVNGDITVIGDTVGGAFGLVGERVYVKNCAVNISGALSGAEYSAGLAGENRGVINNESYVDGENVQTIIADNVFLNSANISGGLVGFNLGGLVMNANVQVNITKSGYGKIVGGIAGRNINGVINNVEFNGQLDAFFTGGIVGTDYTNSMLVNVTTGAGSIAAECKRNNTQLIPKEQVKYFEGSDEIINYENVILTKETLDYMIQASKKFYTYKNIEGGNTNLAEITVKNKVLGLIVGLSYKNLADDLTISFDDIGNIIFNFTNTEEFENKIEQRTLTDGQNDDGTDRGIILRKGLEEKDNVRLIMVDVRVVDFDVEIPTVLYLTGSIVNSFDSWSSSYSEDYVVFIKPVTT